MKKRTIEDLGDDLLAIIGMLFQSRDEWRHLAERLRPFAIAYRSHPLRNTNDKLDEILAEYDRLLAEHAKLQAK